MTFEKIHGIILRSGPESPVKTWWGFMNNAVPGMKHYVVQDNLCTFHFEGTQLMVSDYGNPNLTRRANHSETARFTALLLSQ